MMTVAIMMLIMSTMMVICQALPLLLLLITGAPVSPPAANMEASSRRQSRRQTELLSIETSEAQLADDNDDDDYVDERDLSDTTLPLDSTVNALSRRRSSRRVIPTIRPGTPISPPNSTMEASNHRQSRSQCQNKLPSSEAQLDDDDDDDDNGALSATSLEDRLSELADYRKTHGHCNVPRFYSENYTLGRWVSKQRTQYRLHLEGKESQMSLPRIQELESLDFEWDMYSAAWEDRLAELADYRKIHGHCIVPNKYSENTPLANWVSTQRFNYKLQIKGKTSHMTPSRIQKLESMGFEWGRVTGAAWEDRLSELAHYRKIHGHCNVPKHYSENPILANWVSKQRGFYKLHRQGKASPMTTYRFQALEGLDFE
jgi:hypothetical protein